MPEAVDLGYAIRLPPADAVKYFARKGYPIDPSPRGAGQSPHGWHWWDVWQDAHGRAFTVAKMARRDLLADTHRAIADMLASGKTMRAAGAELESIYRKKEWWGRRFYVDPAGGAERVQLGSPHRIRTILRTNAHTAYAAGREQQQRATRDARPWWEYLAVLDPSTRDRHREMHGAILAADDPAWDVMYPPNGFNCRCRVRSLTPRQMEKTGRQPIRGAEIAEIEQTVGVDKRTGERITRPGARVHWKVGDDNRSFAPDPGWSYNPGRSQFGPGGAPLGPPGKKQLSWQDYGRPERLSPSGPPPKLLPELTPPSPKFSPEQRQRQAARIIERAIDGDAPRPGARRFWEIRTPIETVRLDALGAHPKGHGLVDHMVLKIIGSPEKYNDRHRYANRIVPTLEDPDEIWMTWYPGGRGQYRMQYVKSYADPVLLVVNESPSGDWAFNFFQADQDPAYINEKVRRGNLMWAKGTE